MSSGYIPDEVPAEFWTLIDGAHQDRARLRNLLSQLDQDGLIRFLWNYQEAAAQLKSDPFQPPGISEDGMDELANWVVAQGEAYYRKVWDNPELIPHRQRDVGLLSEAVREYTRRHGESPPINKTGGFV